MSQYFLSLSFLEGELFYRNAVNYDSTMKKDGSIGISKISLILFLFPLPLYFKSSFQKAAVSLRLM